MIRRSSERVKPRANDEVVQQIRDIKAFYGIREQALENLLRADGLLPAGVTRRSGHACVAHPHPIEPAAAAGPAPELAVAPAGVPADPQKIPVRVGPSRIDGQGALRTRPSPRAPKWARSEVSSCPWPKHAPVPKRQMANWLHLRDCHLRQACGGCERPLPIPCAMPIIPAPNLVLKVQQGRVAFTPSADIAAGEGSRPATAKPPCRAPGVSLRCPSLPWATL